MSVVERWNNLGTKAIMKWNEIYEKNSLEFDIFMKLVDIIEGKIPCWILKLIYTLFWKNYFIIMHLCD